MDVSDSIELALFPEHHLVDLWHEGDAPFLDPVHIYNKVYFWTLLTDTAKYSTFQGLVQIEQSIVFSTLLTDTANKLSEPCSHPQQNIFLDPAHIHSKVQYFSGLVQTEQSIVFSTLLTNLNRVLFNPAHIHSKVFIWTAHINSN
jgi:hypothetical protein